MKNKYFLNKKKLFYFFSFFIVLTNGGYYVIDFQHNGCKNNHASVLNILKREIVCVDVTSTWRPKDLYPVMYQDG